MTTKSHTFVCAMAALSAAGAANAASSPLHRGAWVWCSGPESPRNLHVYFRKTFTLNGTPTEAEARITADNRYALYVNGHRVARGPARSHTRWLTYDVVDIAPYLHSGLNAIAALALHYGESTFRSQNARAGFLMEADIQDGASAVRIQTDASWKCLPSIAWDRTLGRMDIQLAFPEVFDARKEPSGWQGVSFDDAGWQQATVIGAAGIAPWTDLSAADIPSPTETPLRPASVAGAFAVRVPPAAAHIDFLPLFDRKGWAVAYAATCLYTPTARDVTLQIGFDDAGKAWLDGALVFERNTSARAAPAQMSTVVHLKPGWHPVMVKVVQLTGPWGLYFGVENGAKGVVLSSEKETAKPGTWRVSPAYEYDGSKGMRAGYDQPFAPESKGVAAGWRVVTAPIATIRSTAAVMRVEEQTAKVTALVTGAATLTTETPQAVFQSKAGQDGAVLLDMGREVFGYPRITVKGAAGGEIVDMGYGEALEGPDGAYVSPKAGVKGRLNPDHNDVAYADRFICRPGDNTFEPQDKRAFRYWQIDIRTGAKAITLAEATLALSTYPVTYRGAFECSDPLLNRIWDMGRWTLQLNMDDAYTDCPWRERAQWWGDARIESLVNYYAFGDTALMRRALIQAVQSQDAEGVVRGVFPTDWDGARLPSFSLMWVQSLWEYYQYTGDASLFAPLMPAVDRLMAFFQLKLDPNLGLLKDVPYWVFIDWAPGMEGQRSGVSGTLNCLYYRALTATSEMARATGDTDKSARYAAKAAQLKAQINGRFWLPSERVYGDWMETDTASGRISQHMSSLAIACGVAPRDRWADTMRRTDADPKSIQIGSPYFASFYLDALYAMGRHEAALAYIRKKWGAMLDWGATTFWEKWEPTDSLCHGWSSCPTRDLPAQYLGVRPTSAGWKEWEMVPAFCDLQWANGTISTPLGDIKAAWKRSESAVTANFNVPKGSVARLRIPLKGLEDATWKVDGRSNPPSSIRVEKTAEYWTATFTQPGDFEVVASIRP